MKLVFQKQNLIFAPKIEIPQNRYLDITSRLFGTEHTNFTQIPEFRFLTSWSRKKTETRISWSRKPGFPGFLVTEIQSSDTTRFWTKTKEKQHFCVSKLQNVCKHVIMPPEHSRDGLGALSSEISILRA